MVVFAVLNALQMNAVLQLNALQMNAVLNALHSAVLNAACRQALGVCIAICK